MRNLLQYRGPFAEGQTISVPPRVDCEYIRIGIQIIKREPMYFNYENNVKPDININGIDYVVPLTEMLVFDGLAELEWNIRFLKDLPAETIIDIVYDVSES